jgi:hypothetical protein
LADEVKRELLKEESERPWFGLKLKKSGKELLGWVFRSEPLDEKL